MLQALGFQAAKSADRGKDTLYCAGRPDLSAVSAGKSLYEKALTYMIDPVQKRLYVRRKPEFAGFPMAGEYALATHSMLNGPSIECRAISRKEYKSLEGIEEIDPAWSCS